MICDLCADATRIHPFHPAWVENTGDELCGDVIYAVSHGWCREVGWNWRWR